MAENKFQVIYEATANDKEGDKITAEILLTEPNTLNSIKIGRIQDNVVKVFIDQSQLNTTQIGVFNFHLILGDDISPHKSWYQFNVEVEPKDVTPIEDLVPFNQD